MDRRKQPHEGVWARLGASPIHGVGVFAIKRIPAATLLFGAENAELHPVDEEAVRALSGAEQALYGDFCVLVEGEYHAPVDFNQMTTAWYLNHSDRPNVACDRDAGFLSLRAIEEGEELTVDYRTFSRSAPERTRTPPIEVQPRPYNGN